MQVRRLWHRLFSAFAVAAMLGGSVPAFAAGTTGQLIGRVTDAESGTPVAGAKVTAASASGIVTATTDATGNFTMLDLSVDTYVVSFELQPYRSEVVFGVTITADASRRIDKRLSSLPATFSGTTRAPSPLLSANSGSSAYSVDAVTQFKTSLADGAGFTNSAYSALSTVPGVFVSTDQMGFNPSISIRGGGSDEVAYGIDGIPLNRPFDNGPGGPASSFGQQELQVFTGSAPADSAVQGLSGVVNQVVRVGTIPGFTSLEGALGGAGFYHQLQFETGGATTNRNFSYDLSLGGYDQAFRFADNFDGRGVSQLYGVPIGSCYDVGISAVPSCYVHGAFVGNGVNAFNSFEGSENPSYALGPADLFATSEIADRNSLVNLHLAIPRRNGLRDDVSFLGTVDYVKTYLVSSQDDFGDGNFLNALDVPNGLEYADGLQFPKSGIFLPANYQHLTTLYKFPSSPLDLGPDATIPFGLEDSRTNNQGLAKLQYTHPFSANALVRVYGYTDYSGEFQDAPDETNYFNATPLTEGQMTVTHSRGLGANFVDQIDARNQLQAGASFTTATTYFQVNYEPDDAYDNFAYVVDSTNPTNGLCYPVTGGAAVSCTSPLAGIATFHLAYHGLIAPASGTCGGGPCRYFVTETGPSGPVNSVTPTYSNGSLTDTFKASKNLSIDGGLRVDTYRDEGALTNTGSAAQAFFYNAFNLDNCIDARGGQVAKAPLAACPSGTTPADLQNPTGRFVQSHTEFEPRLRATYDAGHDTVLRASYARVSQAQPTGQLQNKTLESDSPYYTDKPYGLLYYGIDTPNRVLPPQTSNGYDFSIEHALGPDATFRLTPFYRTTQHQLLGMYRTFGDNIYFNFPASADVGAQTSRGAEFEFDKGRFDRNGLAARLTATYTASFLRYSTYNKYGSTFLDPVNASIASYNAYTSACSTGGKLAGKTQYGVPVCGSTTTGVAASPCYSPATSSADGSTFATGTPEACSAAGAVANPYWNAPAQGLVDPGGEFPTYQTVSQSPGLNTNSYDAPFVASLTLNYKRGPFALTPLLTVQAGRRYGEPDTTFGVSPEACSGLTSAASSDPRYPYGSPGGVGFDAASNASDANGCASGLSIPNPYTRKFDAMGEFVDPSIAQLQIQMTYDVSKNFQIVAGLANVITECFGGSKEPWNVAGACSYTAPANAAFGAGDLGNEYNPGSVIQPYVNTPYLPNFAPAPFGVGVGARLKL